jgi:hypothetical protein
MHNSAYHIGDSASSEVLQVAVEEASSSSGSLSSGCLQDSDSPGSSPAASTAAEVSSIVVCRGISASAANSVQGDWPQHREQRPAKNVDWGDSDSDNDDDMLMPLGQGLSAEDVFMQDDDTFVGSLDCDVMGETIVSQSMANHVRLLCFL